jgi:hypothetical protein
MIAHLRAPSVECRQGVNCFAKSRRYWRNSSRTRRNNTRRSSPDISRCGVVETVIQHDGLSEEHRPRLAGVVADRDRVIEFLTRKFIDVL